MSFVTCKLWAQTGNQMFMIAATIAHALKHGVDYKIPSEGHSPELRTMPFPHLPLWTPADGLGAPYVEEQDQFGRYHEMPYWPKMRLHGYFQNELYFKDYRKEILEAFRIPWLPMKGVVGIHVRRGDYLDHPTKHPVVTKPYIIEALNHVPTANMRQLMFYSDDIPWCKEAFPGYDYSEGRSALEDMMLMSSCEHQIISNSTFSWWAAWLNQNPDKVVVRPKIWFGPGNSGLDSSQICPSSWIPV